MLKLIESFSIDVELVTYPGIVKFQTASNLETPVAHNNACAGDLYLTSVQTTEPLPDDVGHQDLEMNWEFSVAADSFYPAGTSIHRIYRTLVNPQAHFHTSVDVACRNVSGADGGTVITNIWAKYASRNVHTYDGHTMTYYRNGINAPNPNLPFNQALYNPQGNLQYDGRCGHWAAQLQDVLQVHGIDSAYCVILPNNILFGYSPIAIVVRSAFAGQGETSPPFNFTNHAVLYCQDYIYDPSYGFRYGPGTLTACHEQWENYCLVGTWHKNILNEMIGILDSPNRQDSTIHPQP